MENLSVDDAGSQATLPDRNDEKDQHESLDFVVERHPEEDDVGDGLDDGEEREDDPKLHPLHVLHGLLGLEGLEGAVGRIQVEEEQPEHGE